MLNNSRKPVFAWVMYDWANSAFAAVVMAGFFPVFFRKYWLTDAAADDGRGTFYLGIFVSGASLVLALSAPLLGATADAGRSQQRWLLLFATFGILSCAALYFVPEGRWLTAGLVYAAAVVGFSGANIFYDAMLLRVTGAGKRHLVSSLGYAFGYLGGAVILALAMVAVTKPASFGLVDSAQGVRVSFIAVGVWWAVFTVPLMLWLKDPDRGSRTTGVSTVRAGVSRLLVTFREVRKYRPVMIFLLAYWLYIDGVHTIIRMAIDYGMAIGLESSSLLLALLVTQIVGFPATVVFGWVGQKVGPRPAIVTGLTVYLAITVWAVFMTQAWEFYVMAAGIGLVQGGVQSFSRSFYADLIPAEKATEFFGFYNLWGRFAAILGPMVMGVTALWTGSNRLSLLTLCVFFIGGAWLLMRIKTEETV